MFFTVSGGPFGLEGLVGSVGPGVALLLLVATPLLYSVPETLLVGELASMLPVEGGYYQWVKRAFGRFWGFWNGWLSWTYSLLDMAIYPVLLIQYLGFFLPGLGWLERWIVALAMIWGATWLNLRGTRVVGAASGWFVAAVLAPFAVLSVAALVRWLGASARPFPVTPFHAAGTSFLGALGIGVSQSIWNYSGWDNASTIGGEIEEASATYPRALARALPLVTLVYFLTIIPVLALTDWTAWTDGAWPGLARTVVGGWLGVWVALAGMLSAFALFNASCSCIRGFPWCWRRTVSCPRRWRAPMRAVRRRTPCSSRPWCIRSSRCCRSAACSRATCCCTRRRSGSNSRR